MIETNESKTDINISINCQPINQIFTITWAKKNPFNRFWANYSID